MPRRTKKLLIAGTVIAASLGYLGVSAASSGWAYYLDVDGVVTTPPPAGARVRVRGVVGADQADIRPAELKAAFELQGHARHVRVEYRGALPEMFGPGREVLAEGTFNADGVLVADVILTKCSSKYEGRANSPNASAEPAR